MATRSQEAIHRCAVTWMNRVAQPFSVDDLEKLLGILKHCESDSIWGVAIRKVFKDGGDMASLIVSLSSQAIDDPLTMAEIIGVNGTTLLLKYYDTKNPK